MIHFQNLLLPLNTRLSMIYQKGALPAEARNKIIERALAVGTQYLIFFDDDVLFPQITAYRLLNLAIQFPKAACITGVLPLKITPTEPMLYKGDGDGAYWEWPLGVLAPIHSAGAGCMIVNMEYVKKLEGPWFNDVTRESVDGETRRRHHWGHDRFFHIRLSEEAGGLIYADTGLLLAHWDTAMQKAYIMPPSSHCFQVPPHGEAWVTFINSENQVDWKPVIFQHSYNEAFKGYLDWLSGQPVREQKVELISGANPEVPVRSDDGQKAIMGWLRRVQGAQPGSGDQPDPGSNEPRPDPEARDRSYVQRDGYQVADRRRGVSESAVLPHDRAHPDREAEPRISGDV